MVVGIENFYLELFYKNRYLIYFCVFLKNIIEINGCKNNNINYY